jgi:hypothetical protein
MTNSLIISTAKDLYLKYHGSNHRQIERDMRAKGCLTFTRRVFYNQTTPKGTRMGWIEKYGWKSDLAEARSIENGELRIENENPGGEKTILHSQLSILNIQSWLKRISPTMTWDWEYQKIIYRELERVTRGECKRLMIFLPPRHGKSELVTNRYTAWRLQQDPKLNVILGSYNQRLANRFSRKVRITLEDSLNADCGVRNAESHRVSASAKSVPPAVAGGAFQKHLTTNTHEQTRTNSSSTIPQSAFRTPQSRQRLNTVAEWETGLGGGVRAVGVGGGITGFGADLVIIDDPIKSRAEAESKTYRERVWDWFNDDLYTRLEPNAAIILIQTRWHEDDLAGRLLKDMEDGGEHWNVIFFPALAEDEKQFKQDRQDEQDNSSQIKEQNPDHPVHPVNSLSQPRPPAHTRLYSNQDEWAEYDRKFAEYERLRDEQQKREAEEAERLAEYKKNNPEPVDELGRFEGQALCPKRFTVEDLLRIKKKLGTYSFSALYQQRPTPPEGGLFKRAWFAHVVDRPPENLRWCRSYDLAISTKNSADYTASVRCAFDKRTGELFIADMFRARLEFPEQKRLITQKMMMERNTEHASNRPSTVSPLSRSSAATRTLSEKHFAGSASPPTNSPVPSPGPTSPKREKSSSSALRAHQTGSPTFSRRSAHSPVQPTTTRSTPSPSPSKCSHPKNVSCIAFNMCTAERIKQDRQDDQDNCHILKILFILLVLYLRVSAV